MSQRILRPLQRCSRLPLPPPCATTKALPSLLAGSTAQRALHTTLRCDEAVQTSPTDVKGLSVDLDAFVQGQSNLVPRNYDPAPAKAGALDPFEATPHVHVIMSALHPSTKPAKQTLVPLSTHAFGGTPRRDLLHSAVVWYLDGLRRGGGKTKTRAEVSGSGRKLRPQKGTGQARLGDRGSPALRGGGIAHGPRPRDFATKLNRKVRELALRSALSLRWRSGDLFVVPNLLWDSPPRITTKLRHLLTSKQWDNALFLTAPRNPISTGRLPNDNPSAFEPRYDAEELALHKEEVKNFELALRNIPKMECVRLDELGEKARAAAKRGTRESKAPGELHAYSILRRKRLVLDLGALEWIEEYLGGAVFHKLQALDESVDVDEMGGEAEVKEVEEVLQEEEREELEQEAQEFLEEAGAGEKEGNAPRT